MSAITTIIHWDGTPVDRYLLESANACVAHRCPDGAWVWTSGPVGMAEAALATLPEDKPGIPVFSDSMRIAASCRIDNREDLIKALPPPHRPVNGADTALVLAAYMAWGEACVNRLIGDFAFIIWDMVKRRLFAARDFSGARPLYYYANGPTLILASDRTQIFQDRTLPFEVDDEQVMEYLTPAHQMAAGWDQGMFKCLQALPAGSILRAESSNLRVRPYWTWKEKAVVNQPPAQVLEDYLERLQEAVRCRLRSRGPVGMELSGGLDSSAIACLAAQHSGKIKTELHTFSCVFDKAVEADERPRIQAVLDRYPQLIPHYQISDHLFAPQCLSSDWNPQRIMGPFEIWMPPAAHRLYAMAEQVGCRVILNGRYGNELNNGDYVIFYDLLRRGRLPEVLRRLNRDRRIYGKHAFRTFLIEGLLPLLAPMSLLKKALIGRERRRTPAWQVPDFIPALFRRQILDKDEAIRIKRIEDTSVRCPYIRNALNGMFPPKLGVTLQFQQPVETRYPFIDRRLVEMVLAMPQDMKCEHEQPVPRLAVRLHHRQALAGILPDEVRLGNQGVVFTSAVKQSYQPATARTWLLSQPAIHIFERGYATPDSFMAELDKFEHPTGYLAAMICLEGWFRALEEDGSMFRLIRPNSSHRAGNTSPFHQETPSIHERASSYHSR